MHPDLLRQVAWIMRYGKVDHVPDIESVYDFKDNPVGLSIPVLIQYYMPEGNHLAFIAAMRILTQNRVNLGGLRTLSIQETAFYDECKTLLLAYRKLTNPRKINVG